MLQRRNTHNVLKIVSSFIVLILGKDGIYKGLPCVLSEIIRIWKEIITRDYYDYTILIKIIIMLIILYRIIILLILHIFYYASLHVIIREYISLINKECVINTILFIVVTNTIMYLPQVHWGVNQTLIWSQLTVCWVLQCGISMPDEYIITYQWGLSTVQRGTTSLTLLQHLFTYRHPLTSHYISA